MVDAPHSIVPFAGYHTAGRRCGRGWASPHRWTHTACEARVAGGEAVKTHKKKYRREAWIMKRRGTSDAELSMLHRSALTVMKSTSPFGLMPLKKMNVV